MKTTKQTLLTIIICLAILAGVNLVYGAWSNPPYQGVCNDPPCPPGGNTPEPINVGDTSQYKSGALSIGGLLQVGALQLTTDAGAGKVLKSDLSGVATWGIDIDTKCNASGSCSQVCIGSDCRSPWWINWNEIQNRPSGLDDGDQVGGGYVSGGLYGYGEACNNSDCSGCIIAKTPMFSSGGYCKCPIDYTVVCLGSCQMSSGRLLNGSGACYKN